VTLIAYFDASGHPKDGSLLVVPGWLSFQERWQQFEKEWTETLAETNIEYFHMREFTQSRGQFEGWRRKEKKRKRFLGKLISIIHRHLPEGMFKPVAPKNCSE
jgi:hypothetical protein